MVVKCKESCRGKNASLPPSSSEEFAEMFRPLDDLVASHDHATYGAAQGLGQTDGERVKWLSILFQCLSGLDTSIGQAGPIQMKEKPVSVTDLSYVPV